MGSKMSKEELTMNLETFAWYKSHVNNCSKPRWHDHTKCVEKYRNSKEL